MGECFYVSTLGRFHAKCMMSESVLQCHVLVELPICCSNTVFHAIRPYTPNNDQTGVFAKHLSRQSPKSPTIHTHIYIYSYIHIHIIQTHTCIHTYIHTYIYIYIHTYIYIYTYLNYHKHAYVHTAVRTYVHTYTHTHTHTCAHVCTHMYVCIHRGCVNIMYTHISYTVGCTAAVPREAACGFMPVLATACRLVLGTLSSGLGFLG